MLEKLFIVISWVIRWLAYTLFMAAVGAVVFCIAYPLIGSLLGVDRSLEQMAKTGLRNGAFLIGAVWGPGVSLVACIIQARNQRHRSTVSQTT